MGLKVGGIALLCLGQVAQGSVRSLSDYGGDVSQYMNLLQGTSAFNFAPSSVPLHGGNGGYADTEMEADSDLSRKKPKRAMGSEGQGAMKDYGGDYGDYLKLLEGNNALGFNPQSDPIVNNQDLQTDVFGGGMSGRFWSMYKGKESYDSFDESDKEVADDMEMDEFSRQTPEADQPEDRYQNTRVTHEVNAGGDETVVQTLETDKSIFIVYKPLTDQLGHTFAMLENAIASKDGKKMESIMNCLGVKNGSECAGGKHPKSRDSQEEEEKQEQARKATALKNSLETFVEKFNKNVPDPITAVHGLSMNFRNLTLHGMTRLRVCGSVRRQFGDKWRSQLCLPLLSASVDTVTGPGVPFRGKVAVIFRRPKLDVVFRADAKADTDDGANGDQVHVVTLKTSPASSKFVPSYDSSVPLNPWSQISMSGYLVARVKKSLPKLIDRTLVKLMHIVEKLQLE